MTASKKSEGLLTTVKAGIYPNPVLDKIVLRCNFNSAFAIINIFDIKGELLYNHKYAVQGVNELEIPANDLKKGMYILRVQTEQQVHTFKFIKM